MPRMMTVFMDEISDHQRDLTNSASARTYGEMIAYTVSTAKRLKKTMSKLRVDYKNIDRNFEMQGGLISAEPLQIILSAMGHPSAHEKVRVLTLKAQAEKKSFQEVLGNDSEIQDYLERMSEKQRAVIYSPGNYQGIAHQKAWKVIEKWKNKFNIWT